MLTIQLTNLLFHAYHGVYEEEKKIGGAYEVHVSVSYRPVKIPVQHIDETIDYTAIYALIKQQMMQPQLLLETIATLLAQDILDTFLVAEEVSISIKKINPPIAAFQGSVNVNYIAQRKKISNIL